MRRHGSARALRPHPTQPPKVRRDTGPERRVLRIRYPELPTGRFHQRGDRRVVDVADLREQVVLDLKVEAAEQPRGDPLRRAKSTVVST